MVKRNWVHSGTLQQSPSKRELEHGRLSRKAAAEGMVLLRNEGLLPLEANAPIALFGSGVSQTVKGGTGSGDVNNRENISIYDGLKDAGVPIVSEEWILDYQKRYEAARNVWKEKILQDAKGIGDPFNAYAANPFSLPDGRRITVEDIKGALAAVYVISRISGEGKDRRRIEGDYYLSGKEQEDILYLNQANIPLVLILNVGAPVELTDILQEAENIRAILYISLPGQEGGHAAADVLLGKAAPGGRLTTTWAKHYEDYPSSENYGYLNGNLDKEEYKEGIYVGYRYFDSFGIQPLFPFGYGLSYTDFSMQFEGLRVVGTGIEISVSVKNIGELYSGREVVQVYVTLPQTGSAKEYQRLVGFAKTGVLPPDGTQKVIVTIEQKQLACFSEAEQAWIIEGGKYGVWIGNPAASLQLEALLSVSEQVVLERTSEVCKRTAVFEELGVAGFAKNREGEWLALAEEKNVPVFSFMPKEEEKRRYEAPLASGQSVEELISLLHGNIVEEAGVLGATGTNVPGSAGETTDVLEEKYGIRSLVMADGPAGLRLRQSYEVDQKSGTVSAVSVLAVLENGFLEEVQQKHEAAETYYQYCTAFPVGTALAQAWDVDLMREFGRAIAVEMEELHIDMWLAPGMNIHRNPLCGRNFEYYSEDPLVSGLMAAAMTKGVQSHKGCGVTIKHFACNNQETNRYTSNSIVSERALREIYLRGFEICIRQAKPYALMTSYNLINGEHACNRRELLTDVLRDEWNFEGIVMTDWYVTTTVMKTPDSKYKEASAAGCVRAGNDLTMPGGTSDTDDIKNALTEEGHPYHLSRAQLQVCAVRILKLLKELEQE